MDVMTEPSDPPARIDYIRLPNHIATGHYDKEGRLCSDGRSGERAWRPEHGALFITVRDTAFMWGVFAGRLLPGQLGHMVFTNAPGTFLAGVTFTEWRWLKRLGRGEPYLGEEALLPLISVSRGPGVVRVVGRNAWREPLHIAVGIVLADFASY